MINPGHFPGIPQTVILKNALVLLLVPFPPAHLHDAAQRNAAQAQARAQLEDLVPASESLSPAYSHLQTMLQEVRNRQ